MPAHRTAQAPKRRDLGRLLFKSPRPGQARPRPSMEGEEGIDERTTALKRQTRPSQCCTCTTRATARRNFPCAPLPSPLAQTPSHDGCHCPSWPRPDSELPALRGPVNGWSTSTVARVDKRTVLIRAPGVELIEQVDGDRGFRQAGKRWGMGWDAIRK